MCYPNRLIIVKNNYVIYKGGYGPNGYKINEIDKKLDNLYNNK